MKTYTFKFTGRQIGAIGKFSLFTIQIEAYDENAARVALYDTHEHITGLTVSTPKPKLPTVSELKALFVSLKKHIGDDYRASEDPDDSTPAICVTIGANEQGEWSYQTGDNSYTGGAYGFPHWAVVTLTRRANSRELAKEVQNQLSDLMAH